MGPSGVIPAPAPVASSVVDRPRKSPGPLPLTAGRRVATVRGVGPLEAIVAVIVAVGVLLVLANLLTRLGGGSR